MKLKIKKLHPDAVLPSRAYPGDAGLDLTAHSYKYREYTVNCEVCGAKRARKLHVGFGIAVEIPEGHVGLIFPRSSIYKTELRTSNAVGVIDCGYRGELKAVFDVIGHMEGNLDKRLAQLVIVPCLLPEVESVEELSPSERGTGGFGSSDQKGGAA